ncbi:MAG: ATP-binding cassette domain-containing protein, partial [Streptomycetales bacterium]
WALRPRVGVMLQGGGGGYPGAHAGELLRHVARLHAHPLDPAELIDRLGLASTGRTPYRRLSGGERQRLAFAMALIGRPELVFLDEPTAGLDVRARRDAWSLIEQLRSDGVTVVLATHLMDEAERLADLVAIVDRGRVVATGAPAELATLGAANSLRFRGRPGLDLSALLAALPEGANAVEAAPGAYRVEGADEGVGPQLLATVTAWCAAHDVMPDGLAVERGSLEDVFLELTGRELGP